MHEKLGMVKVFDIIVKEDGYFGLYRGLWPHLLKFLPVGGITFLTYEVFIKKFGIDMDYVDKKPNKIK